jgi:hypothetical protein
MRRQRHRAGRAVRRRHRHRHRRDGHGNRRQPQVGHRLRRQHRRRHRGNYRHRRRRRDGHLPERPADRHRRRRDRVGDHRDVLGDLAHQHRRDEEAYCRATRRPGAGRRDAEHRDAEPADAGYPGPPTALRRMDCCPPAACVPRALGPPGADRARDRDGSARVLKHRLAAAQEQAQEREREPEPARGAPAAPVVVQLVWVQRASAPPGPLL